MSDTTSGADDSPKTAADSSKGGVLKQHRSRAAAHRSPVYAQFESITIQEEEEGMDRSSQFMEVLNEFEDKLGSFAEEQIVQGMITAVGENEVIVDVGFKSEGAIPISEFKDGEPPQVGDKIDVFLEKLENQDGLVVLSKEKADFLKVWDQIKDAHETGRVMRGKVARRIKGGLVVNLLGVDAFLPGSQIALRQVPNLDSLIGKELEFKVIKINKRRRNIVVSRRVLLEERRQEQKRKLLSELEVGQIREGQVKNITDFGAFIDLGGVDGLLHLTDMSWGRVSHPSEVVAIGDKLKVKVLLFDREKEKISLGLKQLTPYPWDGVEEKYPVGSRVRGKVVSITDYGAFVELERGVEGLIHISEMSWTRHVKHPSKVLGIGETVETVVLKVDKDNQKISLGLKQVEPDPWSTLEERYPKGTRLTGRVRNLTNFGAFVEIEDGIDGLLHISDISWAKRVRHPSEAVKKGDVIEVVVLDINKEKKRISLGMKQLTENPWDKLAEEYAVGTELEGKITRILERGVVVELRSDVEGFVPVGQLGKEGVQHPAQCYREGDALPLKVIKMDPKNKRIVLSVAAYLRDRDEQTVAEFHARFPMKEPPPEAELADTGKPAEEEKPSDQGAAPGGELEQGKGSSKSAERGQAAEPDREEGASAEGEERGEET